MPMDLRLIISGKIDTSEMDLATLLQSFDSEVEARERCEVMASKTPKKPNYNQQHQNDFVTNSSSNISCYKI